MLITNGHTILVLKVVPNARMCNDIIKNISQTHKCPCKHIWIGIVMLILNKSTNCLFAKCINLRQ